MSKLYGLILCCALVGCSSNGDMSSGPIDAANPISEVPDLANEAPDMAESVDLLVPPPADLSPPSDLAEWWPPYPKPGAYQAVVQQAQADYAAQKTSPARNIATYQPYNDYLNYGVTQQFYNSSNVMLDADGLPMVKEGAAGFVYTPVFMSEYCLSMHGRYVAGQSTLPNFMLGVDKLLSMQDATGALRYDFAWTYYLSGETYQPGWVSSMAQGLAMSVFARAYHVTGDPKYAVAGEKAFGFLMKNVSAGGVADSLKWLHPSLSRHLIFEEYLSTPSNYTLNGYMYTLLGVYDWSQMPSDAAPSTSAAATAFAQGIDTLRQILPYYDIGGFSVYDLGYITWGAAPHIGIWYHSAHIFLLHALYSITNEPILQYYEHIWASYVGQ